VSNEDKCLFLRVSWEIRASLGHVPSTSDSQ
jgi:hypothetical protein